MSQRPLWEAIQEVHESIYAHEQAVLAGTVLNVTEVVLQSRRRIKDSAWRLAAVALSIGRGEQSVPVLVPRPEPVIPRVQIPSNVRRFTHCKHGHEFTRSNTIFRNDGTRACRTCKQERRRRYYAVRTSHQQQNTA